MSRSRITDNPTLKTQPNKNPNTKTFGLFGVIGARGKLAGSSMRNFPFFCRFSIFSATRACNRLSSKRGVVGLHAAIVTLENQQILFNFMRHLSHVFITSPASIQDLQTLFRKTQFTSFLALLFHKILEVGVVWFLWSGLSASGPCNSTNCSSTCRSSSLVRMTSGYSSLNSAFSLICFSLNSFIRAKSGSGSAELVTNATILSPEEEILLHRFLHRRQLVGMSLNTFANYIDLNFQSVQCTEGYYLYAAEVHPCVIS